MLASVGPVIAETRTVALTGGAAPGTPGGVEFSSFGTPVLNGAGQVMFSGFLTGSGVDVSNDGGIWSEGGGGGLTLVAREGDAAPGTPSGVEFSSFNNPVLNGAGQTAFLAAVNGSGIVGLGEIGIWSEGGGGGLTLVARDGDAAPGTPSGVSFLGFGNPVINGLGQTAFLGGLTGGSSGTGIWSEGGGGGLTLVARDGDAAPGTPSGVEFSGLSAPVLNGAGQTAFVGSLTGSGVDSSNNAGIWSEGGGGGLTLVARRGDAAPGTPSGVDFSGFSSPLLNTAGQTAFVGLLTGSGVDNSNDVGIWSEGGGGGLTLVARRGDAAPGTPSGVDFSSLGVPVLNGAGQTAFLGSLTGSGVGNSNDAGIWSEGGGGGLTLVAREGDAAPGTPSGVEFSGFVGSLVLNGSGQTAFSGFLTGSGVDSFNNVGIWAEDPSGLLTLIAREGDSLDVDDSAGVNSRTIGDLGFIFSNSGNEDGRRSVFNELGQLAFRANFTDGSSGVFVSDLAAGFSNWVSAAGGDFGGANNWSTPAAPATDEVAVFNVDADYTVDFTQDVSNERVAFRDGVVTLDLGGNAYTLSGVANGSGASVRVSKTGATPELIVTNGTLAGQTISVGIGGGSGTLDIQSTGAVTAAQGLELGAGGTVNLNGGTLTVPSFNSTGDGTLNHNDGTLTINGGNFTASGTYVVEGAEAGDLSILRVVDGGFAFADAWVVGDVRQGKVVVDGIGSTLTLGNTTALKVGGDGGGTGELNATDGGRAFVQDDLIVASGAGSSGTIIASGFASRILVEDNINLAPNGEGSIHVADGALVSGGDDISIGSGAAGSGSVSVTGAGSVLRAFASLYVGGNGAAAGGSGSLTVSDGGRVTVTDDLRLWNTGSISLEGGTLETGLIEVDDPSDFSWTGGTLRITQESLLVEQAGANRPFGDNVTVPTGGALELPNGSLRVGITTPGTLNVNGTADIGEDLVGENLWVGEQTEGEVNITGRVTVHNGKLLVANTLGSAGTVTVQGANASLDVATALEIGVGGDGELHILDGATATGATLEASRNTGASANIRVDGADSSLTLTGDLYLGGRVAGPGDEATMTITDGGSVTNASAFLGLGETPLTQVTVDGNGSVWASSNLVADADGSGNSVIRVLDGGLVHSSGSASIEGELALADGRVTSYALSLRDLLSVVLSEDTDTSTQAMIDVMFGADVRDARIDVTLDDGFHPLGGESYTILRAADLTASLDDVTLPAARGGVSFDLSVSEIDDAITLDVLGLLGDVNGDGVLDHADLDLIAANDGSADPLYDLNGDGVVSFLANGSGTASDSDFFLRTLIGTEYGDANLDGRVDLIDLDLLGQGYRGLGSGWLFGDFDGSGGATALLDLDLLGQNYGFEASSAPAIPEPRAASIVLLGAVASTAMLRRLRPRGLSRAAVTTSLATFGVFAVVAGPAEATLVVTDTENRATVTVTPTPSSAPGFVVYTFSVDPFALGTEVTAIEADFSAVTLRQVDPGVSTVFTDGNALFPFFAETPTGDSQFLYPSGSLLIGTQSESASSLTAAFTFRNGADAIQTSTPFAQAVLPAGDFGTANLEFIVRDIGVAGVGETALLPGVSFGGVVAIPEANSLLVGGAISVVSLLRRRRARRVA